MTERTMERRAERAKRMRERTAFLSRIADAQRDSDRRARRSLESEFHPRKSEQDPNKTSMYWLD